MNFIYKPINICVGGTTSLSEQRLNKIVRNTFNETNNHAPQFRSFDFFDYSSRFRISEKCLSFNLNMTFHKDECLFIISKARSVM